MNTNFKLKSALGFGFALLVIFIGLNAFDLQQEKKWVAPESAKKLKNPIASDDASIAEGKTLYAQYCKSCHGTKGKGDGPKAANLATDSGDFTSKECQSQTDGELYWKTTEGKDDMPTFKKKIPDDNDRWKIVNYMRTLAVK